MNDADITASKPKTKLETVTLKCNHTHDRQERQKGDKIDVPKATASILRAQGVAE